MRRKFLMAIIVTALVTIVVGLVVLNLTTGDKKITRQVQHHYAVADPQFLRSMGTLLGPPMVAGNRVQTLLKGAQIFPSMLQAIRSASRTITFETYIYWSGGIGREFAEALSERARKESKFTYSSIG